MQQSADQRLPIAIAMPVPVLFQNGNGPGWWQGQGQPRTHEFHTVLPAVQAASSARPGGARVVETEAMIAAAEQRALEAEAMAEAALRLQQAQMRASAAEHALAQQARMMRLQKALHDAMPRGVDVSTTALQRAIAQAEAAAPPGSVLLDAVRVAKEALRIAQDANARREAEERETRRRQAVEDMRRKAEEKARREARKALLGGPRVGKDGGKKKRIRQSTICGDAACQLQKDVARTAIEEEVAGAPAALQVDLHVKPLQLYLHQRGLCVKYCEVERAARRRRTAQRWTAAGQHRAGETQDGMWMSMSELDAVTAPVSMSEFEFLHITYTL